MQGAALHSLLEAMPLPALLIGQDERIVSANSGARALLGQAIVTRHFITVLRQPAVLDAIETCLRDPVPRKTEYLTKAGAQEASFTVSCAQVDPGQGVAVLVSFEDTTHVQQTSQMRRDFVANVSHELRTPLTALMGFIETLRGPARGDDAATDRFLGIMQSEAARMERLVRDLLSLSRVEGEERVRPATPVDLAATIRAVVHALTPLATETQVTFALSLPDTPVMAPADADQLAQVMSNLLENAIKYGGAGNEVMITLTHVENEPLLRGPAATIAVCDQGPGIKDVHLPRLTERFYRVDSHRAREMGGTGLGLAIVKHIVNRHRGRLRVTSKIGQGSEFRVILPSHSPGAG